MEANVFENMINIVQSKKPFTPEQIKILQGIIDSDKEEFEKQTPISQDISRKYVRKIKLSPESKSKMITIAKKLKAGFDKHVSDNKLIEN